MSTDSNQKEVTLLNKILEESSKSLTCLNDLSSEQKLVYLIKVM